MQIVYKIFWVDDDQLKSIHGLYRNVNKWTKTYRPNKVSRAPSCSLLYAFESYETAKYFLTKRKSFYMEPHEMWKCWSGPTFPITKSMDLTDVTAKNLELFWQAGGRCLVENIKARTWSVPHGTIGAKTIMPIEKLL